VIGGVIVFVSVHAAIVGSFDLRGNYIVPLLAELFAVVVAFLVVTMVTETRVWPLEIEPRRFLGLFKGMALGVILVSLCIGVLALLGVYRVTGTNPNYNPWLDILSMGVVAAVAEELAMRGGLFRLSEEGLGTWGATILSGLVFGMMHIANPEATLWGAMAIAIEAGILFAAIYAITRSLWWCIGLHFAWNITQGAVFGSIVSGTGDQQSWLVSQWTGPEILTGGRFGLEASIVPVILLGGLGIGLLIYAQRKGIMVAPIWARKKVLTGQGDPTPDPAT